MTAHRFTPEYRKHVKLINNKFSKSSAIMNKRRACHGQPIGKIIAVRLFAECRDG